MKYHIYIIYVLLCILFIGCGKDKAPDFDNEQSQLVLNACETIAQGNDHDAMNLLNDLRQYQSTASFVEEAQLATRRHINATQINQMLHSGDLKKLKLFLIEAEKQGFLSGDMLLNSDAPDALQALMLYCAKMPWENSTSLQNALGQLAPFVEPLSTTEAFRKFHSEQLQLLKKMQQDELDAKTRRYMVMLDKAAATGNAKDWIQAHNDLHRLKPSDAFFKYETQLNAKIADGDTDWDAYAIALLGNWKNLSAKQRKAALETFAGTPSNLSGKILLTMRANTKESLLAHKAEMEGLGLPPSNDVLICYLGSLDMEYAGDGGTGTHCLGLNEIFSLLGSININTKKEGKR